jgi:hypothetical protein
MLVGRITLPVAPVDMPNVSEALTTVNPQNAQMLKIVENVLTTPRAPQRA